MSVAFLVGAAMPSARARAQGRELPVPVLHVYSQTFNVQQRNFTFNCTTSSLTKRKIRFKTAE